MTVKLKNTTEKCKHKFNKEQMLMWQREQCEKCGMWLHIEDVAKVKIIWKKVKLTKQNKP